MRSPVACARAGCGHAPVVHRGPRDIHVLAGRALQGECVMPNCLCPGYAAPGLEPHIPDDPTPSAPPLEPMRDPA